MKKAMREIIFSIGVCAGLLILAACASPTPMWENSGDLASTSWVLSTLKGNELVPGSSITILFTSDGQAGGSAGCNRYTGTYNVNGSTLTISTPIATTRMACAQEIMLQETAYLNALANVNKYTVSGDQLTLSDVNNNVLLVYKAQSQDLSGSIWQVISYNNGKQAVVSVMIGTTITAEFGTNGSVSGNSGCNSYSGGYKVTGKQVEISQLASTMMFCGAPEGIMDQETQYLAALQSAATFQVEGTTLELRTADGALAVQATAAVTSSPESTGNSIQEINWQWTTLTNQSSGETTTVSNPENYTITFHSDGSLEGKADCNSFSGTYTQDNGLVIKIGTSTMAFCGENSLDQQYLALLGSIVAGGPDGAGGLALENAGGEQRMLFKNGGAATR